VFAETIEGMIDASRHAQSFDASHAELRIDDGEAVGPILHVPTDGTRSSRNG